MNMVLTLSYAEHHGYLLDVFNDYYEKGSFMDVRFVCKGNKVTFAHKLVVASVSSLVRRLISEMACKDEVMTIYLPEVNYNTLNLLLTFLYEGVMKLDISELKDFKDLCNLLCLEMPNAEICEVRRETLSPPRVAPSLAQRLERISSQGTTPVVSKNPVPQSARTRMMQTFNSNVSEVNYQSDVVKKEIEDDPREVDNHNDTTVIAPQVQIKQEREEEINMSDILATPEGVSGSQVTNVVQTDYKVERNDGDPNEPPDISDHHTASDCVSSLAITNVISLSSGARRRGRGQKRTGSARISAKPKKKAKQSLPPE